MQFSTDLALMNTQPQRIKVDDAIRTNDNRGISWCPDSCKGKILNLVSLTNLFETLYLRLPKVTECKEKSMDQSCPSYPKIFVLVLYWSKVEKTKKKSST